MGAYWVRIRRLGLQIDSEWGARWLEFRSKFVESNEIDWALYTNRYPQLSALKSDINVNYLWRNQFVTCERVLNHNRTARLLDNRQAANPAMLNPLLTRYPPEPNTVLLDDIPFSEIGLYTDSWRGNLPAAMVNNLRSDQ